MCRVETCGLKVNFAIVLLICFHVKAVFIQVLGSTLDGNSVNRRLIKLHQPSADIVFKVLNPYSKEKRDLFFFSDPPHLVKTIRNCWQSKHRSLWVSDMWGTVDIDTCSLSATLY